MFEKFTDSEEHGLGTDRGLGLAFSKMTIEAHDAKIWIESTKAGKNTFTIIFPINTKDILA